jgi:FHA domain-containing protein
MRLPFGKKVIKRCARGHQMDLGWRSCPRCTGRARAEIARDMDDATVIVQAAPARPAAAAREQTSAIASLQITAGPSAGAEHRIEAGRTKLGKEPRAEPDARLLAIADSFMSRDHAALVAGMGGVVLVDLGSTNGTWVNRKRVERALLSDGDEVRMGQTVARFTLLIRLA